MNVLKYKEGYRYQVASEFSYNTGIKGHAVSLDGYITLMADGLLIIHAGYAWDGASGPAINTKNFVRGSLVHDALYQLIKEDSLPFSFRPVADKLLVQICKEDGMWAPRRAWVWLAVHTFGANALESDNPVLCIPEDCQ